MIGLAFAVSALVVVLAAALRAGGASLVFTPRADALHDAADGNRRAAAVADLLEERVRIQPAIGIVHSAALVMALLPAAWAMASLTSGARLAAGLVLIGLIVLLIGDILPRSFGRRRPRTIAYRFVGLLQRAVAVGRRASELLTEDDDQDPDDQDPDGQDDEERKLITSVIDFSDTIVREVMVPRTDMVTIQVGASSDVAIDVVIESGYSRVPVSGENVDDIRGIVYAKDLLQLMDQGSGPVAVKDLMREPYFVPETKRIPDLLRDMQGGKVHLAIVVDEFGGTSGMATIEDLIEELVGEIVDEHDNEEELISRDELGRLLVDGRLPVEELSELVGVVLPDDEWDTVGGLVLGLAGRVPRDGEVFEINGLLLTPTRIQGRRISQVAVGEKASS